MVPLGLQTNRIRLQAPWYRQTLRGSLPRRKGRWFLARSKLMAWLLLPLDAPLRRAMPPNAPPLEYLRLSPVTEL